MMMAGWRAKAPAALLSSGSNLGFHRKLCIWLTADCRRMKVVRMRQRRLDQQDLQFCSLFATGTEEGVPAGELADAAAALKAVARLCKRGMTLPEANNIDATGVLLLVDKPLGWTSFDVCAKLRTLLRARKVGHAGTLDPAATGLLVICVGKATKLVDKYQGMNKVYSGTLVLGQGTPSYDSETSVCETLPWEQITDEDIQAAKAAFVGDIMQVPPIFSALKVEGERMYRKARRGEDLQIPPRMVSIYELEIERSQSNRQELHFKVACSKGTYIRSLCYDLGRKLNTCAHLSSLRREKIGEFSVADAWSIAELTALCARHS